MEKNRYIKGLWIGLFLFFTNAYSVQFGTINVTSNPDGGSFTLFSQNSSFVINTTTPYSTTTAPAPSNYHIFWGNLNGYPDPVPGSQSFSLSAGSTVNLFASYTSSPPNAPGNLQSNGISPDKVNVSWQDNSLNEDNFVIQRKLVSDTAFTNAGIVGANNTFFQDTGLTPSTVYEYQVFATNSIGTSSTSNISIATTLDIPLSAPTAAFHSVMTSGFSQLSAIFYDDSLYADTWNWTFGDGGISTLENPGHVYTVSENTSFTVTLIASNYLGVSTTTKPDYVVMGLPPDHLNVSVTTNGVFGMNLLWQDNSINETGFNIYRQTGNGNSFSFLTAVPANQTTYSDFRSDTTVGLDSTVAYAYQVTAFSACTESHPSNTGYAYAVADFYAFITSGFFTPVGISTASITENSSNATQWNWDFGDGNSTTVQNPNEHIYSSTTSAKYVITLTVNNSLNIPNMRTQTLFLSMPPSNLSASTSSGNQVYLNWQDHALYADGYEIQRQINGGGFSLYTTLPSHYSAFTDTGLLVNTDYEYQTRATTFQAVSDFTNTATAHTGTVSIQDWSLYSGNNSAVQDMMDKPKTIRQENR